MSATLEAEQLTKIYQEGAFQVPAVQDVTLTARAGEVVAILKACHAARVPVVLTCSKPRCG